MVSSRVSRDISAAFCSFPDKVDFPTSSSQDINHVATCSNWPIRGSSGPSTGLMSEKMLTMMLVFSRKAMVPARWVPSAMDLWYS